MPNPRGRGSTVVDSHRIHTAKYDADEPSITVTTASRSQPQTFVFPDSRLGRQLAEAAWAQLPQAARGGRWVSEMTLRKGVSSGVRLERALTALGANDIADVRLDLLYAARELAKLGPYEWRPIRQFVITALKQHHPQGASLAAAVQHEMLDSQIESHWTAYSTETADTIENMATTAFRHWYLAQKQLLADVNIDTTDRNWILLSADEVCNALPPVPEHVTEATGLGSQVAHAITHGKASPHGRDANRIDAALWPSRDDLAAAMTAICLADNMGDNLATLQSLTANSVIYSGRDTAIVQTEKARSATEIAVAASTADLTSYGGLVTALVGLTRFSRRWMQLNFDLSQPHLNALTNLVCVSHDFASSTRAIVHPSTTGFANRVRTTSGEALVFPRLRATALKRATERHGRGAAWVTGQMEATRRYYLRKMIPETELAGLVIDAQDKAIEAARAHVASHVDATERERRLAKTAPDKITDVGVATCGNSGNDPATGDPCGRGPVGCFSCPVGFRTPANIPGLQAMVAFAERLRAIDPDEYFNGEAAELCALSQATLDQFSDEAVAAVTPQQVNAMLPIIGAVYFELRT